MRIMTCACVSPCMGVITCMYDFSDVVYSVAQSILILYYGILFVVPLSWIVFGHLRTCSLQVGVRVDVL